MVLQAGCELPSQEKLDETAVWFHWCCKKARRAPVDTLSNSSISVKFSPRYYSPQEIEEYLDGGESVQAFNGCSALVGEEINYDEVCSIAGSGTLYCRPMKFPTKVPCDPPRAISVGYSI